MINIDDIIKNAAKKCGLNTYLFARVSEANYLLDDVYEYPVVLRLFNETVSEGMLVNERRRQTTLIFCTPVGEVEPSTESDVAPITSQMEDIAFCFINELRKSGVRINPIDSMTPFYSRFDTLVAGVQVNITMTYSVC